MKKLIALIMVLAMVLSMAACGGSETTTDEPAGDAALKAACILGVGGLGDQGYNDLIYAGMERAKAELGIDFDYAEPKQVTDFEQIMRDMSNSGEYCVIVCVGFDQMDALMTVAPDYPEQNYAFIDGFIDADNIVNYTCREQEGSFLVGAMAALMKADAATYGLADNGSIGFVGAMENDTILRFAAGYDAGAKYINPDIQILKTFVGAWDNPLEGKNHTLAKYDAGADIVMNVASGTGVGVLEGAKEAGKYAIGVDLNQDYDQPGSILTSMVKRVDTACYSVIKEVVDGTFAGNTVSYLDVAGKGVSLTDFAAIKEALGDKFPEEIITKLAEIEAKIVSGEIVVPNYEGFGPQK